MPRKTGPSGRGGAKNGIHPDPETSRTVDSSKSRDADKERSSRNSPDTSSSGGSQSGQSRTSRADRDIDARPGQHGQSETGGAQNPASPSNIDEPQSGI